MEFLDSLGLKYLINKMKTWVITKLGYFWGSMKLSRGDWNKTQWGFKADIIDNAEQELGKSPKLWLQTTDWMYSKWNDVKLSNIGNEWFGVYTAPAQYNNLKDGNKYQNYYTNNIQVHPNSGNMKAKEIIAGKFKKKYGKANEVLMADGSVSELNDLPNTRMLCLNGIDGSEVTNTPKAFMLKTDNDWDKFCGYRLYNDMLFFQLRNSGIVFQRMNSLLKNPNNGQDIRLPSFYGGGIILYGMKRLGIHYILAVNAEQFGSTTGRHNWDRDTIITKTELYFE